MDETHISIGRISSANCTFLCASMSKIIAAMVEGPHIKTICMKRFLVPVWLSSVKMKPKRFSKEIKPCMIMIIFALEIAY